MMIKLMMCPGRVHSTHASCCMKNAFGFAIFRKIFHKKGMTMHATRMNLYNLIFRMVFLLYTVSIGGRFQATVETGG